MAVLLTVDVQALRLVSKPSDGLLEPLMMSGNESASGIDDGGKEFKKTHIGHRVGSMGACSSHDPPSTINTCAVPRNPLLLFVRRSVVLRRVHVIAQHPRLTLAA
jgi:hypothetical protein